jgi:DNA-binding beta-propeller fold protein YncE
VPLEHQGFIDLPPHVGRGGFDHAAVHSARGRCYVAHTANDAIDVIDLEARKYVGSIAGLTAVAGALVTEAPDYVFTSNRGENTVGIFTPSSFDGHGPSSPSSFDGHGPSSPSSETSVEKVGVGVGPNGLAYDAGRRRLLAAHVGDPGIPGSCTVSIVDVTGRRRIADLPVPGRTRWTIFDHRADVFHVNILDPPQIVVVESADPVRIRRVVNVAHAGPHGLDIDVVRRRLFCACDAGVLVELDADTGQTVATVPIAGVPDVVFFNPALGRVYVAIGDPGLIEVFETEPGPLRRHEAVPTEPGAHTLAFDPARNIVCAFLPTTHRAAVYVDRR